MAARLSDVVTLHAQYAGGFRAPPHSSINTGFTNPRGGYTTLPNAALRAETSDNLEVGIRTAFDRASLGLSGFSNRYDDFIEMTDIGFNPMTRLLEFQSQNLDQAEIRGGRAARRGVPERQRDDPGQLRAHRRRRDSARRRRRPAARRGNAARLHRPRTKG